MSKIDDCPAKLCKFEWAGTEYLADTVKCYDNGLPIRLPNGQVLGIGAWFESWPPRPGISGVVKDLGLYSDAVQAVRVLPNVAICGYGRVGKDTVGKILRRKTPLKYSGSLSWVGLPYMAKRLGVCEQEAWEERHENRELWKQYLDEYREGDPSKLIRESLERGQLVVGVRDVAELKAARAEGLLDHIIWVHKEGTPVDSTVTYTASDCDMVFCNNGTKEELEHEVDLLIGRIDIPRIK